MRREHEAAFQAQDLLDLGRVAVRRHAVRFEVLVGEAEVRARRGLLARARDAGDGIDHHDAVKPHEPGADGGRRRKRCGRGIAARAGDEHALARCTGACGAREVVREQLGQTEGSTLQQVGGRMRRGVPALVDGRILQAEVGRQVDHRRTARDQARCHGERRGVRHGQEHEVARVERRVVVRGEGEVGGAGEAGILRDDGHACQLVGRDYAQIEIGMAQREPNQLDAGKAGRSNDACRDRHVDPLRLPSSDARTRRSSRCVTYDLCICTKMRRFE